MENLTEIGNRFIYTSEFKGKNYIHLREFYEKDGEMKPGTKGVTFLPEQVDEVIQALEKIKKELFS